MVLTTQTINDDFSFSVFVKLWIMATYYAAQFGITLSIVDLKARKTEPAIASHESVKIKNI